MMPSCYGCVYLSKETESWEMPHIWWWECRKRPGVENLTSFPFRNTKCSVFQARPKAPGLGYLDERDT